MSNSNLMKYFVVDVNNGRWAWNKDKEHASIAVPKVLNGLELRLLKLIRNISKNISKGILLTPYHRNKFSSKILRKIEDAKEEMNLHLFIFSDFKLKIEEIIEIESKNASPLLKLRKMDSPQAVKEGRNSFSSSPNSSSYSSNSSNSLRSPLGSPRYENNSNKNNSNKNNSKNVSPNHSPTGLSKKVSVSHMYERLDENEIKERLNQFHQQITDISKTLTICKNCWLEMLDLYNEEDPKQLLIKMKNINKQLHPFEYDDSVIYKELFACQNAFFLIDDATKGLLRKGIHIRVNLNDVMNKMLDVLMRTFLKSVNKYRKSEESSVVENTLYRLKELDIYDIDDKKLQVLLDLKILLDVEPITNPSYEICYKKIGELHRNIHNKMFVLTSLKYLRKYFPAELRNSVDSLIAQINNIHGLISDVKEDDGIDKMEIVDNILRISKEKSMGELEVHSKVLQDMIMDADPGKEFFALNSKLHKINSNISSKYFTLNREDLFKTLDVVGSSTFQNFLSQIENTIIELRKELKRNQIVNLDDIMKVGIVTGKTTMVTTYHKAIEEILASLGTFLANTLHVLVQEMLLNIPDIETNKNIREGLINTYRRSEEALREVNLEDFDDSL